MRFRDFHYRWQWDLQATAEKLWPFLADTNRFNRETGVPAVERSTVQDGSSDPMSRQLSLRFLGLSLQWEEKPFEWVRPRRFGVVRRYGTGPVACLQITTELEPRSEGGTHLIYATDREQLFVLERLAWTDDSTTAAEVIALQVFRDLFASEALRPGQEFSVGSQAVLFTDLRGSTRMYGEIGDAAAFGLVMDHFEVLKECVTRYGGTQVKTIGDSVMAVFRRPLAAFRAVRRAQQILASPQRRFRPLFLKAGLHYGPSIAVNLNGRLDYFGSTVNIAARLQAMSSGGDIVVSEAFRQDPEVSRFLSGEGKDLTVEPVAAKVRGLEDKNFLLYRVVLLGGPGQK